MPSNPMITDDNKYEVIDAYLLGLLNESGRREVEQKMADDPAFHTEVVLQKVLLVELDRQENADTDQLIDQLLAEEAHLVPVFNQTSEEAEPEIEVPIIPIGQNRQKRWRLPVWRVAAGLVLALGLGWVGYRMVAPPTVMATLTYQQRAFGGFGVDSVTSQVPVTFVQKLFGEPEYENGPEGLRLYLTTPPDDPTQWLLTDDADTGTFRLRTPNGTVYSLMPNTVGKREALRPQGR